MARITKNVTIQDGETFQLNAVVRDEAGAPLDLTGGSINVFLSWYRDDTDAAVNSRNNQQVVTAGTASNQHAVDAVGNLTWNAEAADSTIGAAATIDMVARYTVQFPTSRVLIQEIQFKISPLDTVS